MSTVVSVKQRKKPKRVEAEAKRPIHENIRRLRIHLEMTQEELAGHAGVDKTAVSHWEKGKAAPHWRRQRLVAVALGTTVDALNAARAA